MRYTVLLLISLVACSPQQKAGDYITLHNTRIYFEEYGRGTPLLLLQGGGINRSTKDFATCIPELSRYYRVIAFDTPGQGKSELADSLSYELLTEYTSSFIDQLKLDSAYVIGFSDGAIVGLLLAERRSDKVKKVIAVGANNGITAVLPPGMDLVLLLLFLSTNGRRGTRMLSKSMLKCYQEILRSFMMIRIRCGMLLNIFRMLFLKRSIFQ